MQQSYNELRKSNLSEIPTSSSSCFLEKSEFPINFSCCKFCNNYPWCGIVVFSKMEITTLMGFASNRENHGNCL